MKIKRIHIINFAGLKNKTINFKDGFNLIYGENESGKSSIEKFIRMWLYGVHGRGGNIKERKKYMPINGANISGDLVIDYDGREVIIRRVFGISEKDDKCEVIDKDTGKKIKIKYLKEPGKSLLNINYSSFVRSLSIGQYSIDAFKHINNIYSDSMHKESYEEKDNREVVTIELLEQMEEDCLNYKKLLHNKKIKNNNLEKLEVKLSQLSESLSFFNKLDSMGDNLYERISKLKSDQETLEEDLKKYKDNQEFINKTKIEIRRLSGSIDCIEFIGKYRDEIGMLLDSYKDSLKDLKYRIENQSKHKMDRNTKYAGRKMIFTNVEFGILSLIFIFGIVIKSIPIFIACIPIFILLMKKYFKYSVIIRNNKIARKNNDLIEMAKNRVNDDEEEINIYMKETNCDTYEEFIEKITKYDKYAGYKENWETILKKKEREFDMDKFNSLKSVFKKNEEVINLFYDILYCNDMDEVLRRIKKYESLKEEKKNISKRIYELKSEINNISSIMDDIENNLSSGMSIIGLKGSTIDSKLILKLKEIKKNMVLQDSFDQIRTLLGDELNEKVLEKLNRLTLMKFKELRINEDYSMQICEEERFYDVSKLSSGTKNQLYLAFSLSAAEMFFKDKKVPVFLENAFIQYDDIRREKALNILLKSGFEQVIFFTCQSIEKNILDSSNAIYAYIKI